MCGPASLTHPTETAGGKGVESWNFRRASSTAGSIGDDAGETRIRLLWGTPHESCGYHLLRTLSADLENPQFHTVALPAFPAWEDPNHTQSAEQGRGGSCW